MSPAPQSTSWLNRYWALPLMVVISVAIAVFIIKSRPAMEHQASVREGVPVTTIQLQSHSIRPSVLGYGEVYPDVLLDMRTEVSGKIVFVHPQLKKGAILPADTLVVRIDDANYRLALKQAEASLAQNRANLEEQKLADQDAKLDLQLAKDKLKLSETELKRFEKLLSKGSIARSSADNQRSTTLLIRQEVQTLQNKLDTMPYTTEVLKAQIEISESEVATQKLNLQRTEVRLPFDARISTVSSEASQFVSQGSTLFLAQTIDKVLVNAQFSLPQIRLLSRGFDMEPGAFQQLLGNEKNSRSLIERLGLSAKIRLAGDDLGTLWDAQVERISNNLDPASRTLGVIISVNDPYQKAKPGVKPPLMEGMYMEVELWGAPQSYLLVPRDALHEGELYLADSQQQLKRVAVNGYPQQQMLLLDPTEGLDTNSRVITSDIFPAVQGMSLSPSEDSTAQTSMKSWLEAH
ncbi:MAG: hypothetical protein V7739_09685 [Motiliproteus sp.]